MELKVIENTALLLRLHALVQQEREDLAAVVEHLEEVDRRGLAISYAYPSLFDYCVRELHYSEAAAYCRIRAARACRRFPKILDMLRAGDIHLDAVVRIAPHLEGDRALILLERAKGKGSREVMAMLAALSPGPELPDVIRLIGARPAAAPAADNSPLFDSETGGPGLSAGERPLDTLTSQPLETLPEPKEAAVVFTRVRFAFTADEELLALVKRARELLRHKYPDGRLERVFRDALLTLLAKRDPDRKLLAAPPRPKRERRARRIPEWVRNAVWKRDGGCCAYVAENGRKCLSRDGIEYDHVRPWALGGVSDDPGNVRLLCRAHNQHLARQVFKT